MGFFKSTKGSLISDYFRSMETAKGLKEGIMTDIALYDDHIELEPFTKETKLFLPYERITDVYHGDVSEIKEKGHQIGRALAGGFLFGGAGAVVGAISGSGTKTIKKLVLIISYKDKDGNDQYLKFEDTRKYKGKKVAQMLREKAKISDEEETVGKIVEL